MRQGEYLKLQTVIQRRLGIHGLTLEAGTVLLKSFGLKKRVAFRSGLESAISLGLVGLDFTERPRIPGEVAGHHDALESAFVHRPFFPSPTKYLLTLYVFSALPQIVGLSLELAPFLLKPSILHQIHH